jgi:DNA-binding beta-propeller fold protein YncE
MTRRHWLFTLICVLALLVRASSQEKGLVHGPYDLTENWLKPVEEGMLIHATSVFAQSPDRIFIALAGVTPKATAPPDLGAFNSEVPGTKIQHQMYVVNRTGEVIERWSQWDERVSSIHEVAISPYDPEKHVWVTDRGSQQVLKFTNDGRRLVMALGTRGVAGKDDKHFAQPSDIAWLPDGTFFVADGDDMVTGMAGRDASHTLSVVNTRIVKFNNDGKFLLAWDTGTPGPIHGIAVDARRRVYVGERGSRGGRITIFDENGKRLGQWPGAAASRVFITQDQFAWVATDNGLAKFDLNGKRLMHFLTAGNVGNMRLLGPGMTKPDDVSTPHDFSVDSEGNLYVQPASRHVVHKYVAKRNADRNQLVGARLGDGGVSGTR